MQVFFRFPGVFFNAGVFSADAAVTQGFCYSKFGPKSGIFALSEGKFAVIQMKVIQIIEGDSE